MYDYRDKIDELRNRDRGSSNEYAIQVFLVGLCVFLGWLVRGHWELILWFAVVYGLSTVERYLHRRRPQAYSLRLYVSYIAIGTGISMGAAGLPIFLWTFDDRVYHFAAMVYMIGTILNIFVLRSQAWPALLFYAIPQGLAMIIVAFLFLGQDGWQAEIGVAFVLASAITIYLVIITRESVRRVKWARRTTKALLQAQKSETVANFAGGVAHDFNNLLGVIGASLEQASTEENEAERRELINQALIAVDRGAGITKQLLAVGRQSELETRSIDMASFTVELQKFLTRIIPSSINLQVTCDPELKTITSEPTLLQSMLLNLAMNARDAMADGGTLKVSISRATITKIQAVSAGRLMPGTYAAFCVEDDGKGIGSEIFGRVLEPFFSTRPMGEGTGLGLAMVSGFSQQVGGALDIASQEGVGTTVRFYLPLRAAPLPAPRPEVQTHAAPKADGKGLNVLLVEDELSLNQMLNRYLTSRGYKVLSCETGDNAFQAIQDGYKADIVLSDVVMPGRRQGTDLIADLRKILPDATMIIMSGYSFNHDTTALSSSDDSRIAVLEKPFKLTELDRLLARRSERDEAGTQA